jgi:Transposase domain (DUF772)
MLGPPKLRHLDGPVTVAREQLVPRTNVSRHLEAKLDLSFVREWARELYAERGRPAIDPVVVFKLQLIMFFEDIRSKRKLIETASVNLAHRNAASGRVWRRRRLPVRPRRGHGSQPLPGREETPRFREENERNPQRLA